MREDQNSRTPLEIALRTLVQEKGRMIYKSTGKVIQYLREQKIAPKRIKHVELILTESSLVRYLDQLDNGLSAVDCNNILLSAQETGLSDETARVTISSLLYGLNVPQVLEAEEIRNTKGPSEKMRDLYVPPREYQIDLNRIEFIVDQKIALKKEEYTLLNQFVRAGVPKAYRLMGQVLISSEIPETAQKGLEYLQYAADCGEAEAAALLADYYVDENGRKAHKLYVMPGAIALDSKRMGNFLTLKKKRKCRWRQLLLMVGVFVLVEVLMFLFTVSPVTGSHEMARNICTAANLLNLVWLAVRYWMDPYRDLYAEGTPLILSLFVYIMILI